MSLKELTPFQFWAGVVILCLLFSLLVLWIDGKAKETPYHGPTREPVPMQPATLKPKLADYQRILPTMETCGCHLCQELERKRLLDLEEHQKADLDAAIDAGVLPPWVEASEREFKEARNGRA